MQIKRNRTQGFTLVEIMIVVAIIGLLAAIAIPNFAKARSMARTKSCINNMRLIDGAIQQWALEANKTTADAIVSAGVQAYLGRAAGGLFPTCPEGQTAYVMPANVGTKITCPNVGTYTDHVLPD